MEDPQTGHTTPVTVPGRTPEEAFRLLNAIGAGLSGEGARDIYQGNILKTVRDGYKARLVRVEGEIIRRRAALGAHPAEGDLRELAVWAARQRATTARLWRIPQGPGQMTALEARDWGVYGVGGRTFKNLLKRQEVQYGLTGPAAYERILGSAVRDNVKVTADVARASKFLKRGGAALGLAGLAVSAYDIYSAPPGQRGKVAAHEGVDAVGGLIASEGAVGLLGIGAVALGLATPPGWVVLAVGLVAGIAGSYLADRAIFPEDYKPVMGRLGAGIAIEPNQRYAMDDAATHGLGGQIAVPTAQTGNTVQLTIGQTDTEATIARTALRTAAQSAGLDRAAQDAFIRRFANSPDLAPGARTWSSGDSFPRDGAPVQPNDFVRMRGQTIDWPLTADQLSELNRQSAAATQQQR